MIQVFQYRGHNDKVFAIAWSPDSTRLASGSYDRTVQVWNTLAGSRLYTYSRHTDVVEAVAWSPDGALIASCSDDQTVQVWRAPN